MVQYRVQYRKLIGNHLDLTSGRTFSCWGPWKTAHLTDTIGEAMAKQREIEAGGTIHGVEDGSVVRCRIWHGKQRVA